MITLSRGLKNWRDCLSRTLELTMVKQTEIFVGIDPSYNSTGLIVLDQDANIIEQRCLIHFKKLALLICFLFHFWEKNSGLGGFEMGSVGSP